MISEKQAVLREREAYTEGAAFARMEWANLKGWKTVVDAQKLTKKQAEKEYPLPKITRPRTVVIESGVLRLERTVSYDTVASLFVVTYHMGLQSVHASIYDTLLNCSINAADGNKYEALLQDLRSNPTEEVEDEEDDSE